MKLDIRVVTAVSEAQRALNRASCPPGLPNPTGEGPLAIVGGGPSVVGRVRELRDFSGEIWAINQSAEWLRGVGVSCVAATIEATERVAGMMSGPCILADHCSPETFKRATDVRLFRHPIYGPTTACACVVEGAAAGFDQIILYGCEGSYSNGKTHAYRDEAERDLCRVQVGGESYLTKLELLLQSERLARFVRESGFVRERGGGLLAALVEHGDYDVTHVARHLAEAIGVDHDAA